MRQLFRDALARATHSLSIFTYPNFARDPVCHISSRRSLFSHLQSHSDLSMTSHRSLCVFHTKRTVSIISVQGNPQVPLHSDCAWGGESVLREVACKLDGQTCQVRGLYPPPPIPIGLHWTPLDSTGFQWSPTGLLLAQR